MIKRFLNLSRVSKRIVSVLADSCFLGLALWAAFALRYEDSAWLPQDAQYAQFSVTILITLFAFVRLGLYRAVIRYISEQAFLAMIYGVLLSSVTLILTGFLFEVQVPRSVPIIYGALAFLMIAGTRFGVRALINRPLNKFKESVLIVGTGERGMQLASSLNQGIEYRPAAFITLDDAKHRSVMAGVPVYGSDHIALAVRLHGIQRIFLAMEEVSPIDRKDLIVQLETLSVAVQTIPSLSELISGQARINDIRDLDIVDLLGRDPVPADAALLVESLRDKRVLVTGAGGSIGSALCRQIIRQRPRALVLFEQSEYALYAMERELQSLNVIDQLGVEIFPVLGSVTHFRRCETVMQTFGVQIVYHAAAYKHVPIVEQNVIEGVQNNVFGTWHAAEAAIASGVERFVLVSTDKAVRPTNVMGATKRVAELVLQGLALRQDKTVFSMVRFGNVLGSSGSVVPLFRDQIRDGGPVTVTHPDITRYFMTIPEASQLVLQAGSMGEGGEVFVLDMGEPVKIADLARKMIHLMGMTEKTEDFPQGDIGIVYTGLRPGEKLYEELLIGDDPRGTEHPRVMMAREVSMPWADVEQLLENLAKASRNFDCERIVKLLVRAPAGYSPTEEGQVDLVWRHGGRPTVHDAAQPAKVRHLKFQ